VRAVVPVVGAVTGGRAGLGFRSLYDTYLLTLTNGKLSSLLAVYFASVKVEARRLGGAIVVTCTA
jgi:hypothetical protein